MRDIFGDLSDTKLVKTVIKANWENYHYCLERSRSMELSVGKYLTWLVTNMPDHFLNPIVYTELPHGEIDELIENAFTHFISPNIKKLSWLTEEGPPAMETKRSLEARSQGIGAAVVLASLFAARKMGYHVAILKASSMSYNVSYGLRFQDFGKLSLYF